MAEELPPDAAVAVDPRVHAVAVSEPFRELVRRRGRFVRVALLLSCAWFALTILLTAFAHDFMAIQPVRGLSVAYLFGLSIFVVVWVITWLYLRISNRVFTPLEDEARALAGDETGELR